MSPPGPGRTYSAYLAVAMILVIVKIVMRAVH